MTNLCPDITVVDGKDTDGCRLGLSVSELLDLRKGSCKFRSAATCRVDLVVPPFAEDDDVFVLRGWVRDWNIGRRHWDSGCVETAVSIVSLSSRTDAHTRPCKGVDPLLSRALAVHFSQLVALAAAHLVTSLRNSTTPRTSSAALSS